jgi:hypothetical protein
LKTATKYYKKESSLNISINYMNYIYILLHQLKSMGAKPPPKPTL